ncbi:MAG: acyl-CoA dehydrogenase family protein [Hyphomicrobiaceae bacterium]
MAGLMLAVLGIAALFALAMNRAPLWSYAALSAILAVLWPTGLLQGLAGGIPTASLASPFVLVMAGLAAVLGLISVPAIRRALVVRPAFSAVRAILPSVSATETEALEAGTVGWDAELFSGRPDWAKLGAIPGIELTDEERRFLDGPTEDLCRMIDDWRIRHFDKEIPEEIWRFVARHGFLGMLISKAHGGLGFSAQAQSLILGKISSRSPDVATIVMVPNSLGPGELIEKYGTPTRRSTTCRALPAARRSRLSG